MSSARKLVAGAKAGGLGAKQAGSRMAHPIPERPEESLNVSEGLGTADEGGASPPLHPLASLLIREHGLWLPAGTPRGEMFFWFSCWNPTSRNVLVVFLLESHEKCFHSLIPVLLKFQGHGVRRDSQARPLPGFACGLWVSN